jgi:hypothetical protein
VFEFPHVVNLIAGRQFDTIYHEHFSYLSLTAVDRIFQVNGLAVFDVQELSTHGGSLRVFAQRQRPNQRPIQAGVANLLAREAADGVRTRSYYEDFQPSVERMKDDFVRFLIDAKSSGERVAGYGAAAKGITLLNFAGVRRDLMPFIVDANPAKQNTFTPGTHVPVVNPSRLRVERPDYVVIFPWNLRVEISEQLADLGIAGTQFVTAVPRLEVWS